VAAPLQAAQLVNFWFRRVLDKEFDRVLEPAKARLAQPYTKLGSGTEVNFRLQCAALFWGGVERSMSQNPMKKALRETQTLRAGCSKAEPKIFAPSQIPFPGAQDGQNLISRDTFTYKPSLVKIDARHFELSW